MARDGDRVSASRSPVRPRAPPTPNATPPPAPRWPSRPRIVTSTVGDRHHGGGIAPAVQRVDDCPAPALSRTAAVWHLSTPITGRLRDTSTTAIDLALALHPTPAVGGVPTKAAVRLISELEGDRGFYAGAVGWCDASGDGRWVVTIRGAQLSADRAARWRMPAAVSSPSPTPTTKSPRRQRNSSQSSTRWELSNEPTHPSRRTAATPPRSPHDPRRWPNSSTPPISARSPKNKSPQRFSAIHRRCRLTSPRWTARSRRWRCGSSTSPRGTASAGIYLEDLFVRPQFRRRGLARALLAALATECLRPRLHPAVLGGAGLEHRCHRALRGHRRSTAKRVDHLPGVRRDRWPGSAGHALVDRSAAQRTAAGLNSSPNAVNATAPAGIPTAARCESTASTRPPAAATAR